MNWANTNLAVLVTPFAWSWSWAWFPQFGTLEAQLGPLEVRVGWPNRSK